MQCLTRMLKNSEVLLSSVSTNMVFRKTLDTSVTIISPSVPIRNVYVEVKNGDIDQALKRYKKKVREDNSLRMMRARQFNYNPSELRVLFKKEQEIRRKHKTFAEKLKWIMSKRSR